MEELREGWYMYACMRAPSENRRLKDHDRLIFLQKEIPPFIGGRGNVKNFFQDLGKRTSVKIEVKPTSSEKKAEKTLLEKLFFARRTSDSLW